MLRKPDPVESQPLGVAGVASGSAKASFSVISGATVPRSTIESFTAHTT